MSVILFCSSDTRRTADPLRQAQGRLSAPLRCARDDNLTSWNQITGLEGRGLQQGCGSRVRRFKLGPRGAVPTGLGFFFYAYPALKGGAIIFRPAWRDWDNRGTQGLTAGQRLFLDLAFLRR